jgi:hypothetical protein
MRWWTRTPASVRWWRRQTAAGGTRGWHRAAHSALCHPTGKPEVIPRRTCARGVQAAPPHPGDVAAREAPYTHALSKQYTTRLTGPAHTMAAGTLRAARMPIRTAKDHGRRKWRPAAGGGKRVMATRPHGLRPSGSYPPRSCAKGVQAARRHPVKWPVRRRSDRSKVQHFSTPTRGTRKTRLSRALSKESADFDRMAVHTGEPCHGLGAAYRLPSAPYPYDGVIRRLGDPELHHFLGGGLDRFPSGEVTSHARLAIHTDQAPYTG